MCLPAAESTRTTTNADASGVGAHETRAPRVMRAIHSYEGEPEGHLRVKKGAEVTLVDANCLESGWLLVRNGAGQTGFYPAHWLQNAPDSPKSDPAYANVNRKQAERMLRYPGTPFGTYIVRLRAESNSFAISVLALHEEAESRAPCVYHFILQRHPSLGHYNVAEIEMPTCRVRGTDSHSDTVNSTSTCTYSRHDAGMQRNGLNRVY